MIGGNHVNGAAGSKFIPLGIDDARLLAAPILLEGGRERLRIDNHHIDAAVGGEGVQLVEVGTAVNEVPRLFTVLLHEVIHGDVEGLLHALADGDGGHHNDKLAPAVPLVQLKHGFDVDVGFARARFHFHVQRAAAQVTHQALGLMDVVFGLDGADIGQQFLGRQTNRIVFVASIVLRFLRLHGSMDNCSSLGDVAGFGSRLPRSRT